MHGGQDPQVIRLRRTAYNLVRMTKLLAPTQEAPSALST